MTVSLKWFSRALTCLVLLVILNERASGAALIGLSDDEMASLERGEILLETIHNEKSGGAARVTALFHTNADAVWDIIGYCKYEYIYVRGLTHCEMLEGNQFQMTMHHRLRNSWFSPALDFTFAAKRDSNGYGQASLIKGDLKVMEGSWNFMPLAGGARVIVAHEVRIQTKIPVPKWLVRRSLRNDLPDMLACIRGLARASARPDGIKGDLERCPGEIPILEK